MDVGGGLGIDYDGSQTDFESSVNYTLQEYANDVVYHIQNMCDESNVPHPTIITESGRAIAAYHSVLVFNVLGRFRTGRRGSPAGVAADPEQPLIDLAETIPLREFAQSARGVSRLAAGARFGAESVQSGLSAARPAMHRGKSVLGDLPAKFRRWRGEMDYFPEELEGLDAMLSDTYFCNFSLFQSMPDSWAIKQLFPDHADSPA